MPMFKNVFSANPPTQNNFGPANELNLQLASTTWPDGRTWNWVCFIRVKNGATIQYAFDFAADNENEIVVYDYPSWSRVALARINNYDFQLPGHAWQFTNSSGSDSYHVLTGWHKNSGPDGDEPWWQSPMTLNDAQANQIYVGFADNWYNPPFFNGQVFVRRNAREDCTPLYQDQVS
jgi:hypothetical protein